VPTPQETSLSSNDNNYIGARLAENIAKLFRNIASSYSDLFSSLWSSGSKNSLTTTLANSPVLGVTALTLLGAASYLALPFLQSYTNLLMDKGELRKIGQLGRNLEQTLVRVNRAIENYSNIEPNVCMKMALCSLGSNASGMNRKARSRTLETVNGLLRFPGLIEIILQDREYRDAHSYGMNVGNCDAINPAGHCPFNHATWNLIFTRATLLVE